MLAAHENQHGNVGLNHRTHDPLGQIEYWVEFVEARNRYIEVSEPTNTDPSAITEALGRMEVAYQRWSVT